MTIKDISWQLENFHKLTKEELEKYGRQIDRRVRELEKERVDTRLASTLLSPDLKVGVLLKDKYNSKRHHLIKSVTNKHIETYRIGFYTEKYDNQTRLLTETHKYTLEDFALWHWSEEDGGLRVTQESEVQEFIKTHLNEQLKEFNLQVTTTE